MDRLNLSSLTANERQRLQASGLALNDKSNNEENISEESFFQLPIGALNSSSSSSDLNNNSLQFHLKAENGQISYRVCDFGAPNKKTNSLFNRQLAASLEANLSSLSTLASLSSLEQAQRTMNRTTVSRRKKQPPAQTQTLASENGAKNASSVRLSEKKSKHNEIERKRRDKINNWIIKLSKIVPDCQDDTAKQSQSKGVILSKACDYIYDLTKHNIKMSSFQEENSKLKKELNETKKNNGELIRENDRLRKLLAENNITIKEGRGKK